MRWDEIDRLRRLVPVQIDRHLANWARWARHYRFEAGYRNYADAKERSPLAGEAKPLERAAKNLGGINKDMEQVRRDQSLTPAEKRQKIDALTVERNALLKQAVIESKSAQKETTQCACSQFRGESSGWNARQFRRQSAGSG